MILSHPLPAIAPLTVELFDSVELLDDEKEAIQAKRDLLAWMGAHKADGDDHVFAALVTVRDEPAFMGGFVETSPGVAEVFILPDKNGIRKYPKEFHRLVKVFLLWVEGFDWVKQTQTASVPLPRIDGWMKALKFRCEGDTNSYTRSGQKYKLWSRVKVDGVWQPN